MKRIAQFISKSKEENNKVKPTPTLRKTPTPTLRKTPTPTLGNIIEDIEMKSNNNVSSDTDTSQKINEYENTIKKLIEELDKRNKKILDEEINKSKNESMIASSNLEIKKLSDKVKSYDLEETTDDNLILYNDAMTGKLNNSFKNKNTSDIRFINTKYIYNNEIIFTANLVCGIILCMFSVIYTS